MTERCPACHADVVDTGVAPGGSLRCDRCHTRFPKPRPRVATGGRDDHDLGIHPALAKRYVKVNDGQGSVNALPAAPKPKHGDTRVLGGAMPSAEGLSLDDGLQPAAPAGVQPGSPEAKNTAPGRPAAIASMDPSAAQATARAARPAAPVEPLPAIPGYDVLEMIGKGAMGRVYRAKHKASGRLAAIKTLAPELATRADFVQRFEREGAAMRAISHPGVVQVWDQGAAGNDIYYIAMAFVSGHPLRKYLEKGPLPITQALRFTRRILHALGAAHAPGVIHRDLKPENILMAGAPGDERPILVDFGLAGILEEENDPHPNLTKSRMTMGTVNYMAPEQRTDAKRVDQRADLYAAGVMFYELITGDLPLGRFALPTERGFGVVKSVDDVVEKALARNADERYQTAAEFDAALAAIERELGVDSGPDIGSEAARESKPAADTIVAAAPSNETIPGRRVDVRRDSSEPGMAARGSTSTSASTSSTSPSMVSLAPAGASGLTAIESVLPAAWATQLPTVTPRWIAGGVALMVGTIIGLVLLRL